MSIYISSTIPSKGPPPEGREWIPTANFTNGMNTLVAYHTVNTALGAVCSVIAAANLIIFMGSPKFRLMYKMLMTLALADMINTIAMMFMGINRIQMYSAVIDTLSIPIRTSWNCAIEPWLWLKGIGDLWPPIIQLIMGMERACSVLYPMFFRQKVERWTVLLIGVTILFVVVSLIVGFTLAFVNRNDGNVLYYCGRKAAFSKGYGTFIYLTNVFSYVGGFIFNCIAYGKALTLRKSSFRSNQVRKIRYYLIVSLLSTLLVSIPNAISLCSSWIKEVDNAISKPSVWMACINSAIAPFVYLFFNKDYQTRVINVLKFRSPQKVEISELSTTVRGSSFA